ncbi:MAG: hypothetical protein ACK4Z9_01495 [Thermodesulfovibrionales bacterium]
MKDLKIILSIMILSLLIIPMTERGLQKRELAYVSVAYAEEATNFKWRARRPGITRAQIALGRAVTLPFEFTITGNVKKVRFEIPKKFSDLGIDIMEDEVNVKNGMAASSVLFSVPPGKPLGKFELTITAKDPATGKVLGQGNIPFMLLPPGVGGC